MAENDFLRWLRQRLQPKDADVSSGSGPDDCAHVKVGDRRLAMTADAFCESSHFAPGTPPDRIAAKAVRASLSDLAASGCRPRWLLVSACLRQGLGEEWAKVFAESLAVNAETFGAAIIGGDTTSAPQGIFIAVDAIGEPYPGGPVLRSAAQAGDALVVTGRLGGSLAGKHLFPEPRFAEMQALLRFQEQCCGGRRFVGGGMDISDGLALDLSRLCSESGVGATLEAAAVPLAEAALQAAKSSGKTALEHALTDGEDFELLVTVDADLWPQFLVWLDSGGNADGQACLAAFSRIGFITAEKELRIRDCAGAINPLAAKGFEHQW